MSTPRSTFGFKLSPIAFIVLNSTSYSTQQREFPYVRFNTVFALHSSATNSKNAQHIACNLLEHSSLAAKFLERTDVSGITYVVVQQELRLPLIPCSCVEKIDEISFSRHILLHCYTMKFEWLLKYFQYLLYLKVLLYADLFGHVV